MSKHQYLISKYHWNSRENFLELSADSTFSFLSIGSKTKTRNWWKTFYNRFIANYTSLTSTRGFESCFSTHAFFLVWLGSVFLLKKEVTTPIFHFKKFLITKKQKLNETKDFLLDINIDSKCLNIGI